MGFESIVEKVNALPPLPESVRQIQALYAQGDPDMRKLVRVIEEDPILTADILARVNAPIYFFSRNIVSVQQAATLVGLGPLRGFVLASSVTRAFEIDMRPYGLSNEAFKRISNLQSALMFQWYMGVDIELAKVLVPIAFLLEMGKVVIAKEVGESEYMETFQAELRAAASIAQTERLFTDMTSAEVNALLFEHWHFNELFIGSMKHLDDPLRAPEEYRPLVEALDVVRTCVNVRECMTDESVAAAKTLLMKYDLPLERFEHTVARLKRGLEAQ